MQDRQKNKRVRRRINRIGRCRLSEVSYLAEASFGPSIISEREDFYAWTKNAGTEFSLCAWAHKRTGSSDAGHDGGHGGPSIVKVS